MKKRIVFDIDGTLITTDKNPSPRHSVIALLKTFHHLGWDIYIHSGGGVEYAARWTRHLKLDEEIHIKIAIKGDKTIKYDIAVDDCAEEMEWTKTKSGNYVKADYYIMV